MSLVSKKQTFSLYLILLWRAIGLMRNWHLEVREALQLFPPRELVFRLRNGWEIQGRKHSIDRCSFNEVWLERTYDPSDFDWSTCRVIIDVGAHIGSASLYFHRRAPQAQVFAFEPSPANFSILQRNVQRNGLEDAIHTIESGVGGTAGPRTLYLMKSTGGNSLYEYEDDGTPITIAMTTLPQVFAHQRIDRCNLLKLDCEGAEYEILYSCPPQLLRRIDCIVLEYHRYDSRPGATPQQLAAYLDEQGFHTEFQEPTILHARRRS